MIYKKLKPLFKVILYIIGIAVIMIAGVKTGVTIASNTSILDSLRPNTISPSDLLNKTSFSIGESLPVISASNSIGKTVNIDSLLNGYSTIIGFVSEGCDPCKVFVEAMLRESILKDDNCQLILLSSDPGYFTENYSIPSYYISNEFLESNLINGFPTIVGVNNNGIMVFISSGYIPLINSRFLSNHM
ncbi:MAG: hypothetical protein KAR42_08455 [candidate division Zixibacteria bacterium]|nr:hypothetical protein [candidate division Zixibacteria bacterium]